MTRIKYAFVRVPDNFDSVLQILLKNNFFPKSVKHKTDAFRYLAEVFNSLLNNKQSWGVSLESFLNNELEKVKRKK